MGNLVSSAGSSATSSDESSTTTSTPTSMASALGARPTHIAMPPSAFSNVNISVTPSPSSRLEDPFESPMYSPALVFYTAPSTPIVESPGSQTPPQVQHHAPGSPPLTPVLHIAIPHVLPPSQSQFSLHTPPSTYPPATFSSSSMILPAPPPEHVALYPSTSSQQTDEVFPESPEPPDALDDEGLSTLEKIYLYSRSKSSFHRVFIANALPELLEQVTPHEAIEYVLPLLNTLAMDDDEMVKEAFSSKLMAIIWWFFTHCQLIPGDTVDEDSLNPPEFQDHEGIPTISVQAFTPILGTLLLSPNVLVGGATRYAVVALLGRIKRVNAGESPSGQSVPVQERPEDALRTLFPKADDDEDIVIGLFGQEERALFEKELLLQVVVGMGRLDEEGDEVQDGAAEDQQQAVSVYPKLSPAVEKPRQPRQPQVEIVLNDDEDTAYHHPKLDSQIVSPRHNAPEGETTLSASEVKQLSLGHNPYFPPLPLPSYVAPVRTSSSGSPASITSADSTSSSTPSSTSGSSASSSPGISSVNPSPRASQSPHSTSDTTITSTSSPDASSPLPPDPISLPRPVSPPLLSSHQSDIHAFSNVTELSEGNWPPSPSRSPQQDASNYGALSHTGTEQQPSTTLVGSLSYESLDFDEEGDFDHAAIGRLSSMSLMAAVAASGYLDAESTEAFVEEVERVSRDPLYWVRREACFALGALAKVVPAEVVQLTLMHTLQRLTSDPIHHVRHSSLFALPTILSRLPLSQRRQVAVSVMTSMSKDEYAEVRAGVLEALGEVIYTFYEEEKTKTTHNFAVPRLKESETPPEELLKMFLGRTKDRRVIDGQQPQPEGETKPISPITDQKQALEAFYTNPSRPLICAFNFPAVTLTVGRDRWESSLRDTYLWLASSNTPSIKRTLAASLGEMAKILGRERAQRDLMGVWRSAFLTPGDDVRLKSLECLVPLVGALPQEGQFEALNLLLEVWSSNGFTAWREREVIAKSLHSLLNIVGFKGSNIVRELMLYALADPANTVREAAIFMLPDIWMTFKGRNQLDELRIDFLSMARSQISRRRMTYIACQHALLLPGPEGGDPPVTINDELCSTLVSLASDSIVGVRIGVARLIEFICDDMRKKNTLIPMSLLGVIPTLANDSSYEVRSYVADCLDEPSGPSGHHQELISPLKSVSSALTFSRPPPVRNVASIKTRTSPLQ